MVFLLQLYAPINDIPSAFHRALYLYCCRSLACTRNSNLICLRTQFPRENKYLPLNSEDGVGKMIYQPEIFNQNLCVVCGNLGSQRCSGCKKVYYCTREHQLEDWKLGHKSICQSMSSTFSSALSCPCSPSSSSRLSSIDDNENQTKPDRIEKMPEGEREEKGKDKGKDKDKDYQQQQKQHHDQQQQQQESLIRIVAEKQKQEVEGKPVNENRKGKEIIREEHKSVPQDMPMLLSDEEEEQEESSPSDQISSNLKNHDSSSPSPSSLRSRYILDEFDIVVEVEDDCQLDDKTDNERLEELKVYEQDEKREDRKEDEEDEDFYCSSI